MRCMDGMTYDRMERAGQHGEGMGQKGMRWKGMESDGKARWDGTRQRGTGWKEMERDRIERGRKGRREGEQRGMGWKGPKLMERDREGQKGTMMRTG